MKQALTDLATQHAPTQGQPNEQGQETETMRYIGVKIVTAVPMTRKTHEASQGSNMVNDDQEPDRHGYQVTYPDGYVSWSPTATFEEANRPTDGMSFGHALEAARKGLKIAREGWNGKGMFVNLIIAGNAMHRGFNMQDCLGLKNAQGNMQPGWVPSQGDLFADDWAIID